MRFKVEKKSLKDALEVASLATSNDSPLTASVLFDLSTGSLTLVGNNRRIISKVPTPLVEGSLHGTGAFTVEASRLQQWVKNVLDDEIEVEVEGQDVQMTCGTAKGHFVSLDAAEFSDYESRLTNAEPLFELDPATFTAALNFVAPFIGGGTTNNQTANNFQVAELRGSNMMATNARVISLFQIANEDDELSGYLDSDGDRFKVSKDEIKALSTFLEKTCDRSFVVSKSDLYIIESDDGSVFGYAEPLYNLPNIPDIPIALQEPEIWSVDRVKLQTAIKALTATADKNDTVLSMVAEGAQEGEAVLTLTMNDALDKHESVVQIPFQREKSESPSVNFKINHEHLMQTLKLYEADDIRFGVQVGSGTKYVKLFEETAKNDTRICFIPLRLDVA